jgi:hypothetical protein
MALIAIGILIGMAIGVNSGITAFVSVARGTDYRTAVTPWYWHLPPIAWWVAGIIFLLLTIIAWWVAYGPDQNHSADPA